MWSRVTQSHWGWTYFIRCPATDLIKIGYTDGVPRGRLGVLQTGSASRLTLIGTTWAEKGHETQLHYEFSKSRVRGEWFRATPELVRHICCNARGEPQLVVDFARTVHPSLCMALACYGITIERYLSRLDRGDYPWQPFEEVVDDEADDYFDGDIEINGVPLGLNPFLP